MKRPFPDIIIINAPGVVWNVPQPGVEDNYCCTRDAAIAWQDQFRPERYTGARDDDDAFENHLKREAIRTTAWSITFERTTYVFTYEDEQGFSHKLETIKILLDVTTCDILTAEGGIWRAIPYARLWL